VQFLIGPLFKSGRRVILRSQAKGERSELMVAFGGVLGLFGFRQVITCQKNFTKSLPFLYRFWEISTKGSQRINLKTEV